MHNNEHNKTVLLAKTKLNRIQVLISRAIINSHISHNEFVSVENLLREYDDMKAQIKNLKTSAVHQGFYSFYKIMLSYCVKYGKNTESKNPRVIKTNKGKLMLSLKCALCDSKNQD